MTCCPHCGCELTTANRRSGAQNRYWWGVIVAELAKHCGYHHDEMHDALKEKFLSREDLGTGLRHIRGTKTLTVQEMTVLIDEVRVWAHVDLGVYLPAPNEVDEVAA